MIGAVIFDMDGLLLDSEPFWQEAEIEVFGGLGIPLTKEQCAEFMGVPINEVVEHRFREKPWTAKTTQEVQDEIIERVKQMVLERGKPLAGVHESIAFVRAKGIPCALASSSSMRLISAVLGKFNLQSAFAVIHSAEFEAFGKPHPGVFLTTAATLGVAPGACLVLEDSFNGILAAKAAQMRVIAVPPREYAADPRFIIADAVIGSLTAFGEGVWGKVVGLRH
jgi:HAD superfamily hydrolase (TIGR01509 family)